MYGGSILYTWFYDKDSPTKLHHSVSELFEARGLEKPTGGRLPAWVGSISANKLEVAYKKLQKVGR